ncbi:MAG: stage III sporulation protein AD [Lachnospiraceae bacterium]|nr:stage III sporulation protein AD [Lachnospiraceae bacterium]
MISAAILGITAMLLAVQLKNMRSELGLYVALASTIIIFSYGVDKLAVVLEMVNRLSGYLSIPAAYLGILMKMVGITYICEFASALCRDGGYQSIAVQLETFGKLSILAVSTPVILSLFETIESLLG